MNIPNISGISYINPKPVPMVIRKKQVPMKMSSVPVGRNVSMKINPMPIGKNIKSPMVKSAASSKYIQAVDMMIANNEKAFLYDNGNVDIQKPTGIKTIKFPNKKSAALYLMKAGWKYVR